MNLSSLLHILIIAACLCVLIANVSDAGSIHGITRSRCENRNAIQKFHDGKEISVYEERLSVVRSKMHRLAAYIVTSFDEHQNHEEDFAESRIKHLTGFSGPTADVVITSKSAALWTHSKFLDRADLELDCEWKLFVIGEEPTIAMWLATQIPPNGWVGANTRKIPHTMWQEWERDLSRESLHLRNVNDLIDAQSGINEACSRSCIKTHNSTFSGASWQNKIDTLRERLKSHRCDSIVVTSLTEIAYLLNLRGKDFRYVPVFRAYLIVSEREVILYTDRTNVSMEVQLAMHYDTKSNMCYKERCVQIKNYDDIWDDLPVISRQWRRVLMPTMTIFDSGVSEAIYASVDKRIVHERISPVVYMRAQKNDVEREGMRRANVRDAVALCDTLSYLEERYIQGDRWTESLLAQQIERPRYEQLLNQGLAFRTIVAFGRNAAKPYYYPSNSSDIEITNENLVLIDSGGQYLDGTTSVARTILLHLGEPTNEQKRAYTNVLMSLIRLSMLAFPENLKPAELDTLIREPLWSAKQDYPHISGSGIGSYLSAEESPIHLSYKTQHKYSLKDGYFFTVEPGYYKKDEFGIRLKNVFEVVRSDRKGFLEMRVATLVPFETRLIDRTMLSSQEKKWLNNYNARIREIVGDELKRQFKIPAFYWLMNQTEHIREYLTEEEYLQSSSHRIEHFNLHYLLMTITLIGSLTTLLLY